MEKIIERLGGWPDYFGAAEIRHAESLAARMIRDRLLDEVTFGIVIRYAVHRAEFDRLSYEIKVSLAEGESADAAGFLSGSEQARAFHENRCAAIEQQLLGTPYARAKVKDTLQASFMDTLDAAEAAAARGPATVTPFQPLRMPKVGA